MSTPAYIANFNQLPDHLLQVRFGDSSNIDAFGRLRVSNPENLFDSKNIFDNTDIANTEENQPFHYDNVEVSGSGTSTAYLPNESSQSLSVGNLTAGRRTRQTKRRFNYQPGKSLLIDMSFKMGASASGITQREGYFDNNNGIYLEDDGTGLYICKRSYTTGAAVNTRIAQADWNTDPMDGTGPSKLTIDTTKTNILFIDIEWLGVGSVRVGFVIDNMAILCHKFNHSNQLTVPYMQTPNLPLRSEIINDGTGPATTITQICSTVISEGAQDKTGEVRYQSTRGTAVVAATENTVYLVIAYRLKQSYLGMTIEELGASINIETANSTVEWILIRNPSIAGTALSWVDKPRSAIQYALGVANNVVTGGFEIIGGYVNSLGPSTGRSGSTNAEIHNSLVLGSTYAGVSDIHCLCVRPIAGSTNVSVEGSIEWRELS